MGSADAPLEPEEALAAADAALQLQRTAAQLGARNAQRRGAGETDEAGGDGALGSLFPFRFLAPSGVVRRLDWATACYRYPPATQPARESDRSQKRPLSQLKASRLRHPPPPFPRSSLPLPRGRPRPPLCLPPPRRGARPVRRAGDAAGGAGDQRRGRGAGASASRSLLPLCLGCLRLFRETAL